MQIDTIVTDLDDTLLNGTAKLGAYTMEIIAEVKRRGIRFIPASGRAASSMRPFVEQLATSYPYIACNGAQILNPDHTEIFSVMFTPQQARALVRYFDEKGFYSQCYKGDYFYYAQPCEANERYAAQTGMKGKAVGDLAAFIDFPTPKVLSLNDPEEVARLYPLIQADFPEISFTISKPYFLEAEPMGVSKGAAVQKLGEILHFAPERTMVFGDSLNDISMFDYTENSVAIANAREEVKRAARYTTELPNTQDGLAHFLAAHVLN